MRINKKAPMNIAVQLENNDKRVWLTLPAMLYKFEDEIKRIDGDCTCFRIREHLCRVPAMNRNMLSQEPLAVVNYLAYRLNKLSDDEIQNLCAICDSDYYFDRVGQYIDYTFQTYCYTLLPGVTDEEALGEHYVGNLKNYMADKVLRQHIDLREYGRRLAEAEKGAFTSIGYLTSSIGWNLPPKDRRIPDSLNLKGYLGEDLFGEGTEPVVSAFGGIEI